MHVHLVVALAHRFDMPRYIVIVLPPSGPHIAMAQIQQEAHHVVVLVERGRTHAMKVLYTQNKYIQTQAG